MMAFDLGRSDAAQRRAAQQGVGGGRDRHPRRERSHAAALYEELRIRHRTRYVSAGGLLFCNVTAVCV